MAKRTATPPPPPWMPTDGSSLPQRPYLPTPLPGVVDGDDPWADAAADLEAARRQQRGGIPAWPFLVLLFSLGVVGSIGATFYFTKEAPPEAVVVAPVWHPGDGALVRGMPVDGGLPQSLAWSPDGQTLAWSSFDGKRAVPRVQMVTIGDDFGEIEDADRSPKWLDDVDRALFPASVEEDLVVLREPSGRVAGVIDLRGLLGLGEPRVPVTHTAGNRVRLAVVAQLPNEGALPSLHIFDVTDLVRPPAPDVAGASLVTASIEPQSTGSTD
ncbi:MAG: hypothetical protein AB8H79_04585 [Myxococcota bacterium]